MMNTKLLVATAVASLSLATAAFASEGKGNPFPLNLPLYTVTVAGAPRDVGSEGYPAPRQTLSSANTAVALLPSNGGNGGVESVNSRPPNWSVGTEQYMQAESLKRWRAEQAEDGYAGATAASHTHS
jgi:hypothetical protein